MVRRLDQGGGPMLGPVDVSDDLIEILRTRRAQVGFRATTPIVMAVFFANLLGVIPMVVWAGSYAALQLLELMVFPKSRLDALDQQAIRTRPVLVLLFLNGLVFGASSLMWATLVGSWGIACAGYLIAGSMLNVVLTTPGCRIAFRASIAPYLGYVAVVPLVVLAKSGVGVAAALGLAGGMMSYCALKLWTQSGKSRASEEAARRELAERVSQANADRAFLDAIVENVPAMLVVKDARTGRFALLNSAGEALLGAERRDVLGKTDHELFPADQAEFFVKCDREVLASGQPVVIASETVSTPFGTRTLRTKKVVIEGADGPQYLLAVAEDITDQQAAALALEEALEHAKAANVAKSTFLATMSHEIRTPLNGVLGMAQAMAGDQLSGRQRDRLNVIRESGEGLLAILNDVLDLSKIEAGKLDLEEIDFDLEEVARGPYTAFTSIANRKGISFALDLGNAGGGYRGDPTRLRQILYNLISNALKFTECGEIRVTARARPSGLELRVSDTGIGMSGDTVAGLFTSFGQADASTTRRFGGTGLGLAISLELAELMGGTIQVDSALGQGSVFYLTLPLPRVQLASAAPCLAPLNLEPAAQLELRVLAAEDNTVNQLVLRTLLDQIGINPVMVENGALAVEAWETGSFDLVLMDIQMPVMDGPTASRTIRAREVETGRPRIPIIALTANVMSHQIADYHLAGMDAHVAKPIEAGKLFAALEAVINAGPSQMVPQRSKRARKSGK